jgi:D-sedoheptulose 7-phosphate isomerase
VRTFISEYQRNFIELLSSVVVTDSEGKFLSIDDGIEDICTIIETRSPQSGKVMFIGNGGSAAIASHMALDFWKNGGIKSMCFNDSSLLTCIGNDYGYQHVFEKPIEMFACGADTLIAISSSGRSENILRGVDAAATKGCEIITLSGFDDDNPLRKMGTYNIYVSARQYGPVEIIHLYICHWILDAIINEKNKNLV